MAIDTPAKIAILGAGPIGLEAALYARFLGYDVELFDRGQVADNVRRWGHVRMFSPFRMNCTPLGLAALRAQDDAYSPPDEANLLTGAQWADQYLIPLSQTDLLADHLRLDATVVSVSRPGLLKQQGIGSEEREASSFRILVRERSGREWVSEADAVLDATGVFGNANWLGAGGAPARGEASARARIRYDLPDVLGTERQRFAGRRVAVVGAGHSAATSVTALAELARHEPATAVTWMTRAAIAAGAAGPLADMDNDPLVERHRLVQAAHQAVVPSGPVALWPETVIETIYWNESEQCFELELSGLHAGAARFDEVIGNVGYRPDVTLYEELQVHQCYATAGPMALAAKLMKQEHGDCLKQRSHGAASLLTTEPDFYILGAKSYGRNPDFLVAVGYQQIREVFSIIGDREDLNLYASAHKLLT